MDTGMLKNDGPTSQEQMSAYGGYGQTAGSQYVTYSGVMDDTGETEIFDVYVKGSNKYNDKADRYYKKGNDWYIINDEGKMEKSSAPADSNVRMENHQEKIKVDGTEYDQYQGANGEKLYKKGDKFYVAVYDKGDDKFYATQDKEYTGTHSQPTKVKVSEESPLYIGQGGVELYKKDNQYYKYSDDEAYTGSASAVYSADQLTVKVGENQLPLYTGIHGEQLYKDNNKYYYVGSDKEYTYSAGTYESTLTKVLLYTEQECQLYYGRTVI